MCYSQQRGDNSFKLPALWCFCFFVLIEGIYWIILLFCQYHGFIARLQIRMPSIRTAPEAP